MDMWKILNFPYNKMNFCYILSICSTPSKLTYYAYESSRREQISTSSGSHAQEKRMYQQDDIDGVSVSLE